MTNRLLRLVTRNGHWRPELALALPLLGLVVGGIVWLLLPRYDRECEALRVRVEEAERRLAHTGGDLDLCRDQLQDMNDMVDRTIDHAQDVLELLERIAPPREDPEVLRIADELEKSIGRLRERRAGEEPSPEPLP